MEFGWQVRTPSDSTSKRGSETSETGAYILPFVEEINEEEYDRAKSLSFDKPVEEQPTFAMSTVGFFLAIYTSNGYSQCN